MDFRTGLVVTILMMLLNGGVLGLMHKGFSADVQSSASDWRIGTLLFAAGCVLLTVQDLLSTVFVLPLANASVLAGVSLYWRSTRRFMGREDTAWIYSPAIVASAGVLWFVLVTPDDTIRVYFATSALVICFWAAAYTLQGEAGDMELRSQRVLSWIFVIGGFFFLLRGIAFVFSPTRSASMLDTNGIFSFLAPVVITSLPVVGTTVFLVMCSERIRKQWEHAAATDYLTNLPNRRTITEVGEAHCNTHRRHASGFAVALIDIDHFKQVNDQHGHDAGDAALKHVAVLLAQQCRGPSMVGRQGGEEFVAVLVVANAHEAALAGERLRHAVASSPFTWLENQLTITISIGISVMPPFHSSYENMLRRADQAVYAAKKGGRNQVVVAEFEDEHHVLV